MIEVKCSTCNGISLNYPCRIKGGKKTFCSKPCHSKYKAKVGVSLGKRFGFQKGQKHPPELYKKIAALLKNDGHPKWKGEKVSYRGLHQWIRRNKGHGKKCSKCGFESDRPRMIQWANKDGLYRRILEDYFPLCCSCHKIHDRALKGQPYLGLRGKSTQGGWFATQ